MSIKKSFSINDLENLSGVKAHTIRIWEKRYNLLQPQRSDTNIRTYDHDNLKKILNVALLNNYGHKVSKIAALTEDELHQRVSDIAVSENHSTHSINTFKVAMLNFDQRLFDETYNDLLTKHSFQKIFQDVFLPFLENIGLLWLSKTIVPAHEHFVFTLIKQKLLIKIEEAQSARNKSEKTFVLFLPINEIHDLGLLYVHFELLLKGYRSIFLGQSVPTQNLIELQNTFNKVVFISYFTVEPIAQKAEEFLSDISEKILSKRNETLHILGRNTLHLNSKKLPTNITCHKDIISLINTF